MSNTKSSFNYRADSPQYLTDFLDHISVIKGRSVLTVKNYYTDLRLFLRYLKINNDSSLSEKEFSEITIADTPESYVRSVTLTDILGFLHFTMDERLNQQKARARKAVSIRQFFKFLTDNKGWFEVSPAAKLELPSPKNGLPKHLSIEQANQLLSECSEIKNWADARDYCMITFFLNCGMRLSELVGISVNDYIKSTDPQTNVTYSFLKVIGKGNKERIVYLNNACVSAYDAYIAVRPDVQEEKALFLSKRSKRISNRRVEQIIEEKLKQSGLAGYGYSVHKLRHTAATLMYQNGVDVRILKEVLGHENLNTTQIYTHVSDNQIKQAMDQNPLADIKAPRKKRDKKDQIMYEKFNCPICGNILIKCNNSLKCSKNHCYDISSSGYVNLLTKGGKKGHGDDRNMVRARRDFLSKGYYSHLRKEITKTLAEKVGKNCVLLDSGCGEGYYTSAFYNVLKENKDSEIYGIDVSKEALKLAAKLCPKVNFAVASAYCLPFENESFDIITSIFAPLALNEFQRTLKQGGYFITAIPLERHLFGLKEAVYKNPYPNKPESTELKGFEPTDSVNVKKEIILESTEDIKNLFMMTPYYYKTSAEDQKKLDTIKKLSTETEFLVLSYKKVN